MNRDEAGRIMAALAANWPNTKATAETIDVWWNSALERCELRVALDVVMAIVAEDEFFPTVARFHSLRRAQERATEPGALEASPTTPGEQARGNAFIARLRAELADLVSPWGTAAVPTRPPKDWTPRHTGDVSDGSWKSCKACHPEQAA